MKQQSSAVGPVRILGVMGSPRSRGSSALMLESALDGARSVSGIEVAEFHFSGRRFLPCIGCMACAQDARCRLQDDFDEFLEEWLRADGLIYSVPVYHAGIPALLKAALERLGNVMFSYYGRRLPAFLKVGGVLAQGTSRYGGQELAINSLIQHLLLMNCLPVSADIPGCYLGAAGHAPTVDRGSIAADTTALEAAHDTGRRVAEVAAIVRSGIRVTDTHLGTTILGTGLPTGSALHNRSMKG